MKRLITKAIKKCLIAIVFGWCGFTVMRGSLVSIESTSV